MLNGSPEGAAHESVLAAAWRHRWVTALIIVAFGVGGYFVSGLQSELYVAEAAIILEDPSTASVLGADSLRATDRLVTNQLAVLQSEVVASRARELALEEGVEISAQAIERDVTFATSRDTDVIELTHASEDFDAASVLLPSIIQAYKDTRLAQQRAETDVILERLTTAEEAIRAEVRPVTTQINGIRSELGLETKIDDVLDEIAVVQEQLAGLVAQEARTPLMVRLLDLREQLELLQIASVAEIQRPGLAELVQSRDELLEQLSEIATRKSELEIESRSTSDGVAFDDARVFVSEGAGRLFTIAASVILGAFIALGVAYGLSGRRRRFQDRFEPGELLELQLLSDIPDFRAAGVKSEVAVRDEPRSAVAEAFRFATSSIELGLEEAGTNITMAVSSTIGVGKSTIVANVAMAATRAGHRVLVIDADFGNQALSKLVLGDIRLAPGLPEITEGTHQLEDAVGRVEVGAAGSFDLLGRGIRPVVAPDFFSSRVTHQAINDLAADYDMVLIDGPPLMQVAYASTIARVAKTSIMIIPHRASMGEMRELHDRLRFVGSRVLGYVYNRSPVRPEMMEARGSMADILGDRGMEAPLRTRSGK
jgi:Mrp family chromosome partitioning ATPase